MTRTALACCALLLLPLLAWGGVSVSTPSAPERGNKAAWVARLQESQATLARARARYEQAVRNYSRMRSHRKARGERKKEIMDERDAAKLALDEAEHELQELLQDARRAGVPPGWIRDALPEGTNGSPASQSP